MCEQGPFSEGSPRTGKFFIPRLEKRGKRKKERRRLEGSHKFPVEGETVLAVQPAPSSLSILFTIYGRENGQKRMNSELIRGHRLLIG